MTTPSEIAYETGETSLANQRQAVEYLRSRAATLLAAAALVASFLGAQALSASEARTKTAPTATTTTTFATTTTPETTTAITHGVTTEINESGATERTHGTSTATMHGGATAATHATSTTLPVARPGTGIQLNWREWGAVGALVVLAILCIAILLPWDWKGWHTSAKVLVEGYVDAGWTVQPMHRRLALYDEQYYEANIPKIKGLQWCFRVGCALLVVQVAFWILDLAIR